MAEKVSRIVVRVKWGKNYERALVVAQELKLVLANPRHICATRFAADERKVYKNVANNWLALLKVNTHHPRHPVGSPLHRPPCHAPFRAHPPHTPAPPCALT